MRNEVVFQAFGIYGQEKDLATYNMARMNMVLHGMYWSDLRQDDTLNSPQHRQGTQLDTFDYVVANPPFSLKKWMKSAKEQDVYGRWSPLDAELPRLDHSSLLSLPIPPQKEQRRIAQVLSDTDSLIASLSRTIEKKRLVKQGAMQQLLTGKTRLKGFSGEWVEKVIGNIGKTYNGITGKTKADFGCGNARYITFLNVLNNPIIDINILERVNINFDEGQNDVRRGDLFFNTSSETPEEVGICATLKQNVEEVYLNSFCFGFRISDEDVDNQYLAYYFRSEQGRALMTMLAQGATRYNLSKDNFNKSCIVLPPTRDEQQAIANILTTMDNEIASLEAELQKYKFLKQGMMQKLLTGQIRLK